MKDIGSGRFNRGELIVVRMRRSRLTLEEKWRSIGSFSIREQIFRMIVGGSRLQSVIRMEAQRKFRCRRAYPPWIYDWKKESELDRTVRSDQSRRSISISGADTDWSVRKRLVSEENSKKVTTSFRIAVTFLLLRFYLGLQDAVCLKPLGILRRKLRVFLRWDADCLCKCLQEVTVIVEPAFLTCLIDRFSFSKQWLCDRDSFGSNIFVDRCPGRRFENAAQVGRTQIEIFGEFFDCQWILNVLVDISQNPVNLLVLRRAKRRCDRKIVVRENFIQKYH